MKQMFKCENGNLFPLDDCICISVLRPDEVQILFKSEDVTYYAKVGTVDKQNVSRDCYNIVRKDYDRLVAERTKEMFKCENGDLFSLDTCISMSELCSEAVRKLWEKEGITYYAELCITDVAKSFLVRQNITRKDYDCLSEVYIDPISGNHI